MRLCGLCALRTFGSSASRRPARSRPGSAVPKRDASCGETGVSTTTAPIVPHGRSRASAGLRQGFRAPLLPRSPAGPGCQSTGRRISRQGQPPETGVFVNERQPVFNAPGVVIALLGALIAVHLGRALLSQGADALVLELAAFIPARLGPDHAHFAGGWAAAATQFVTHVFVHADLTHLIVNSAWFLAFATPVARRLGSVRFLAFFVVCGVGGALLFLPINTAPMIGASGAISGLMGAA